MRGWRHPMSKRNAGGPQNSPKDEFCDNRYQKHLKRYTPQLLQCRFYLVSTYVVCDRLSVMHKQVSSWTVNFCPNSPESPFLEFQTRKPPLQKKWKTSDLRWPKFTPEYPPNKKLQISDDQSLLWNTPPMKNFRFEMTKVYSGIPSPQMKNFRFEMTKVYSGIPPPMKNFRFEMTKVYSGIPPQWKTSDLRWPKFTAEYPPNEKLKNFRFEMTKVYSGIPPNEKLHIWDDESLLRNTPPQMKNFRFEMTKVYSGIPRHWKTSDFRTKVHSGIPCPNEKLQIWDDQSLLRNTPPMKNFRIWWLKFTLPPNEKLHIWDDQSLLWNTPPMIDLRWPKFTLEYPPMMYLRWPKFTPEYPPHKWKTSYLRWPKFTPEYPPN